MRIKAVVGSVTKRVAIVAPLATCVVVLPLLFRTSSWAFDVLNVAFRLVEPVHWVLFGGPGSAIMLEVIKLVVSATLVYVPLSYLPQFVVACTRITQRVARRAITDRPELFLSSLAGAVLGALGSGFAWGATLVRIGPLPAIALGAVTSAWLAGILHWCIWELLSRERTVARYGVDA